MQKIFHLPSSNSVKNPLIVYIILYKVIFSVKVKRTTAFTVVLLPKLHVQKISFYFQMNPSMLRASLYDHPL